MISCASLNFLNMSEQAKEAGDSRLYRAFLGVLSQVPERRWRESQKKVLDDIVADVMEDGEYSSRVKAWGDPLVHEACLVGEGAVTDWVNDRLGSVRYNLRGGL